MHNITTLFTRSTSCCFVASFLVLTGLVFTGVVMPASTTFAATKNDGFELGASSVNQTHNGSQLATQTMIVAQNAAADGKCEKKPLVNVKSNAAIRVYCEQGRFDDQQKYEVSRFVPAIANGDELHVIQTKLIRSNMYFPTQRETVRDSIPRVFNEIASAKFSGGDQTLGWGGSYVYVIFEIDNKTCFGFRKNRREKLTRGYYCRKNVPAYSSAQIKSILKQFTFR